MNVAVSGLRHGHMAGIAKHLAAISGVKIVAVAEENPQAAAGFLKTAGLTVTHSSLDAMLKEVDFDILAVGDVYCKRGAQVIAGLRAGKHIMADKPLCTRVEEVRAIRELAREKRRSVMVALTMRYGATVQTLRRAVQDGLIGQVVSATVHGQHPLSYRTGRPDWYFQEGQHGGTINDLMIHGVDALAWITGHPVAEVVGARAWHVEPAEAPWFQDGAQVLLRLANGAGVMMEASYKAAVGHKTPWSFQFWGTEGDLVTMPDGTIRLRRHNEPVRELPGTVELPGDCTKDLLHEISPIPGHRPALTTAECLDASERTLRIQEAADTQKAHVQLG